MPKTAKELQREQRWVSDLEKRAYLGVEARHDWWAGIDEAQKAYYRGLVRNVRIIVPGNPSEEDRGPHIPASRDPIGATLSQVAVQMLCDFDFEEWDRQIAEDGQAGRLGWLDALADEARKEHAEGRTTLL